MPQGSEEVIFIALILGVAIFILIGLLTLVVFIHHYEHRRNDKFTLSSLVRTTADFFPKPESKEEPGLSLPALTGTTAVSEQETKIELKSGQRVIKGILFTTVLISGLILVMVYTYPKRDDHLNFLGGDVPIYLINLTLVCTALGGAIGVRIGRLPWQDTVAAALLSGLSLVVFSRFEFSPLFPGPWNITLENIPILGTVLTFVIVIAAGVFLLPLFDPAVRQIGPAPSRWKVVLVTIFLFILIARADIGGNSWRGELIKFGILPAALAMIGLILSLTPLKDVGAWVGAIAIMFPLALLIGFLIFGFFI